MDYVDHTVLVHAVHTGPAIAVRKTGLAEDSLGCRLRNQAAAGLRRRGCNRSPGRGLDLDCNNPDRTFCSAIYKVLSGNGELGC